MVRPGHDLSCSTPRAPKETVLDNLSEARGVESKTRNIPLAVRVGAAHGGAAERGGAGQDGTPTGRFAQETTDALAPQTIEDNRAELNAPPEA